MFALNRHRSDSPSVLHEPERPVQAKPTHGDVKLGDSSSSHLGLEARGDTVEGSPRSRSPGPSASPRASLQGLPTELHLQIAGHLTIADNANVAKAARSMGAPYAETAAKQTARELQTRAAEFQKQMAWKMRMIF